MEALTERCRICHFAAELDDIALKSAAGRYICLHCFQRATEPPRPFPKALRRELETILFAMDQTSA